MAKRKTSKKAPKAAKPKEARGYEGTSKKSTGYEGTEKKSTGREGT